MCYDAWIYLQVAPQLLSVKEKEEVTELVDTMIGFGISYKHQKPGMARAQYGVDAQSALVLDPPIDSLVKYTVVFGCTTFMSWIFDELCICIWFDLFLEFASSRIFKMEFWFNWWIVNSSYLTVMNLCSPYFVP